MGLWVTIGVLPNPFPILLSQLGETGNESFSVFTDTGAILLVLNPTVIKASASSTKMVQIVGVLHKLQQVPLSKPIPFGLGPLRDTYPFLLSSSTSIYLLGRDFLEIYHAGISFSRNGEIILELDSSNQNSQISKANDPSTSSISSASDDTRAKFRDTNNLSLLDQLPPSLLAKSLTDIGRVHLLLRSK